MIFFTFNDPARESILATMGMQRRTTGKYCGHAAQPASLLLQYSWEILDPEC